MRDLLVVGVMIALTIVAALVFEKDDVAKIMASGVAVTASSEVVNGDRIIVLDGDTVALPCTKPERGCAEKVRLLDIDTPETFHPSCEAERIAGLKAKERLAGLIRGKDVTVTRSGDIDRYGRTLGRLLLIGETDAGAVLRQEGLALKYESGREAKLARTAHWCQST